MQILEWSRLDPAAQRAALARPAAVHSVAVTDQARAIIEAVRRDGDAALLRLTREFDGAAITALQVTESEFVAAEAAVAVADRRAIQAAIANVATFHLAQAPTAVSTDTQRGVRCESVIRPIQSVGLYVPAGSAPLPSTVIMLAVPAQIAGCRQRVLCTPPRRDGSANPAVLVAARLCGVSAVYKAGGAQAIAAMAYGTASIPKVAKVFGPGNAWVTAAKQLVAADPAGAALDMPAGPSEVMVIADDTARADFIAADLLAQAEHDASAQAVLLTDSLPLAREVLRRLGQQWPALSRNDILSRSVKSIRLVVMPDIDTALRVADDYAPEHLLIETRNPRELVGRVNNAGSVFLGEWSPEPLGDYCSGTNHVLPTYGYARAYSGLSVFDFVRRMTVQELTADGLRDLGPVAATLARLEGLDAHAAAVQIRLTNLPAVVAAGTDRR